MIIIIIPGPESSNFLISTGFKISVLPIILSKYLLRSFAAKILYLSILCLSIVYFSQYFICHYKFSVVSCYLLTSNRITSIWSWKNKNVCWWYAGLRSLLARPNWMPFCQDFELCGRHQWMVVQQSPPIWTPAKLRWCGAPELFSKSVVICSDQPVQAVCNLGIWLDSDCSMTTHINKTTRSCCASLREIRSIAAPL